MRKNIAFISIFVLLSFLVSMCSSTPGGGSEAEQYELEVIINPDNAGTVSPDGGSYEEGDEVSLSATPSSGWQFENWSGGGISSSDNPLEIVMTSDLTVTANFIGGAESFSGQMTVTDGQHSRNLVFALTEESGVGEGLDDHDVESPPIAPSGTFFTGFSHEGMNLYEDYRPLPDGSSEVIWELQLNRNEMDNMELSWSLDSSLEGTLMLVDNPEDDTPAVEVDLQANSGYTVTDPSLQSLFIVYTLPEAEKIITDIEGPGDDSNKGLRLNQSADQYIDTSRQAGNKNMQNDN